MQLSHAVAAYLQQSRQRRRAPTTIDHYHYQLEQLWLAWRAAQGLPDDLAAVTAEELRDYFAHLAHGYVNRRSGRAGLSTETISSAWRTLRALWNYALAQGWLPEEQRGLFGRADLRPPPPVAHPPLDAAVFAALLAACAAVADPEEQARDRAVVRLLEAGLRPGQIAALRDEVVDLRERRAQLARADERPVTVLWGYHAAVALRAYLRRRCGPAGGALLRTTRGPQAGRALTATAISRLARRLARHAGVDLPPGAILR